MILADLPPAGDPVNIRESGPPPIFPDYRALWLQSGTAALALGLAHARSQRPDIAAPEVLIPAYACPDLVAAAEFARVRPVLVDIGAEDCGFKLKALHNSCNENTLALIAVNFLGIRERIEDVRANLPEDVVLLEDNAQCHPEASNTLRGDYVVTSFGRGKPASILGGGLLLLSKRLPLDNRWLQEHVSDLKRGVVFDKLQHRAKVILYNFLRHPRFYFWVNRNPLLTLGATCYKALDAIEFMPPHRRSLVASNARCHLASSRWRERAYDEIFTELSAMQALGLSCGQRRGRLLRYPLLCQSNSQRDWLLSALQKRGLGATALYQRPLLEIAGVKNRVLVHSQPKNADGFAARLLTLPLHSGVERRHIRAIAAVSREAIRWTQQAGSELHEPARQ